MGTTTAIARYVRANAFLVGVVAVIVMGGGWYFFGPHAAEKPETFTVQRGNFTQTVSVSGTVIAAEVVDMGFTQSGRVARVFVRVGDRVNEGTPLASLESGDLRAAVLQRQAALESERAKLAQLVQGTRPEEIEVTESKVRSDESALSQADQKLLDSIREAYTTADDVVHNKADQFFTNPRGSDPQLSFVVTDASLERDVESRRLSVEAALAVWRDAIAALSTTSDLTFAVKNAGNNLDAVKALLVGANNALNRAIPAGSQTQTTIDGWITSMATARSNVDAALAALTTAVTAQKSAVSTLETDRRQLSLLKAGTRQSDIDAQKARVRAAEADVANAEVQVGKTSIVAPFAGIVTRMDVKVGEIASPNVPEVTLMSEGTFQIESYVPEVNIALLALGDSARITLDAYGDKVLFTAKIISIDPAETVRDGVSTYRSRLEFDEADPRIKAGMTANVVIVTDEKANVISIPQKVIFERDGKKYVRILADGIIVERVVETGSASSLGGIEILSGLLEGEVVVLPAL